jgi:hypothetical protein
MAPHEEFLELCAAATAGELSAAEKAKIGAHLAECPACRQALADLEVTSQHGVAALASEFASDESGIESSWSVAKAEKAFFKRLEKEQGTHKEEIENQNYRSKRGRLITYRVFPNLRPELWMPFAAAEVLALALGISVYRSGERRGTEVARSAPDPAENSGTLPAERASDVGQGRAMLLAKIAEENQITFGLMRQVSEQKKTIEALVASSNARPQACRNSSNVGQYREEELAAAQAKSQELQKAIDTLIRQREELTSRVAILDTKIEELTQLVRNRGRELDQRGDEVAKLQDLLEHDRDIRELMGARDLYIADVHDVAGTGQTSRTHGRVFYTRGKRLVFYAYDLDAQPGVKLASSFQVWGRNGPDQKQALNLGILYEDSVDKKRWVLKANDARTLVDIDAVFVTVEPNGGSRHPSGKQLLFAYLRIGPNHP